MALGDVEETALKKHPFIRGMLAENFSREEVSVVLGQWFHPLHCFPNFLSRHIALSPDIASKTYISKILWQELGEGDPTRSHETIFVDTMVENGFSCSAVSQAAPFRSTTKLVSAFDTAGISKYETSLGYLFATEAADLVMVGAIGNSVRRVTGAAKLPWVDIHVSQEPDHTRSVQDALSEALSPEQLTIVNNAAADMFRLWSDFFTEIEANLH